MRYIFGVFLKRNSKISLSLRNRETKFTPFVLLLYFLQKIISLRRGLVLKKYWGY